MSVVSFSRCEVNRTSGKPPGKVLRWTENRVKIELPFLIKERLKNTGFAEWSADRRFWHIPATPYCLSEAVRQLRTASKPVEVRMVDSFTEALWNAARTIQDVQIEQLPGAILPPWNHQQVGSCAVGQLAGSMLAYDMGTGKTKTVLDSVQHHRMSRVLVLCPASVIDVWGREAKKHLRRDRFPYRLLELDKRFSLPDRKKLLASTIDECDVSGEALIAVTNYEAISSPSGTSLREFIADREWDLVVVDESHRIASHTTVINKYLVRRLRHKARRRVGLSGTPLGDGPIAIYGQFLFLEPGVYGTSITRFRSRYCVMGGFESKEIRGYVNLDDLQKKMAEISLRVRVDDVLDLPDATDEERLVSLNTESMRLYSELAKEFIADCKSGVIMGDNVLTRLLRFQQITSGFVITTNPDDPKDKQTVELNTAKADSLKDLLIDIDREEPIVVFVRFVHDLNEVGRVAFEAGRPWFQLGGGKHQKAEWIHSAEGKEGPVFAVQIQAGGVGIDLTAARYGVYYSLGVSLVDYRQSRARLVRPGQHRPVFFYHLIAPGTIDRTWYRSRARKGSLVDYVSEGITNPDSLMGELFMPSESLQT